MFKFKKFNFSFENLAQQDVLTFFEIVKLVTMHKGRLFDDFVKKPPMEHVLSVIETYNPYFWVITDKKTGKFAGFAYLYDIIGDESRMYSASVTTCFSKAFWGKPSRDAGRMFLKYCFKKFGLSKIKAECFASNPHIAGFLRDLSFKREGVLKCETIVNNKPENLVIWAKYST